LAKGRGIDLKIVLLKIAAAAAGITLALCIAAGAVLWYVSKPKPQKPWNEKALVSTDAPGFDSYGEKDNQAISLAYIVKNTTNSDYSIDAGHQIKIVVVLRDGALSLPMDEDHVVVRTPLFIPANHLGTIVLHLKKLIALQQNQSESNEAYHERLRLLMNEHLSGIRGFVIFDESKRYQIDLPRWLETKPEKESQGIPQ
jgi:hypothetical protein